MSSYSTSEFKSGLKVMLEGDPCSIIENEFVKPGKGQAFNRVKLRNLKTFKILERTFKSGDSLKSADVVDMDMDFLYDDGERADRTWVIRKTGTDEGGIISYEGSAADVSGMASGRVAGNALNWEYDVVLEMSGSEVKVHFDDWIYRQDEDVAINRAFILSLIHI